MASGIQRPKPMVREAPGVYAGCDVRAERVDVVWSAQVRMRDCGAPLGCETGVFEYCGEGGWVAVGSYRTLRIVEIAAERLRSGSHVFRSGYSDDLGKVPGQIVEFSQVLDLLAEASGHSGPPITR